MDNEIMQAALMQILAGLVHIVELGQRLELIPVGGCQEHLVLFKKGSELFGFADRDGLDNEFIAEIQRQVIKQIRPAVTIDDNEFCSQQVRRGEVSHFPASGFPECPCR